MSFFSIVRLTVLGGALTASIMCPTTIATEVEAVAAHSANDSERPKLLSRGTGYLVYTRNSRELFALSLRSGKERLVREVSAQEADSDPTIHAISGPDNEGRIAYIKDSYFLTEEENQKHRLKTVKVDGTADTKVFRRPGDAMWASSAAGNGAIGTYLALAPSGGKVALLSNTHSKQMPKALLTEGQIEIWDTGKKQRHKKTINAIDEPMSWFPDARRLAHVKLVPRNELPKPRTGLEYFGEYFGKKWDEVPAVYVLDVKTGRTSFLHVGRVPHVSHDGKMVLVGGWNTQGEFSWNRFDLETRESKPVTLPDDTGSVIAAPSENTVLYLASTTEGMSKESEANESEKWTCIVRAAFLDSGKVHTVASGIGHCDSMSFGRIIKAE